MSSWARMAAGFGGPEHRSLWYAGDRQAAVLVHGFPGTPYEVRPLADALHRAGWTVRAPLLPGFGAGLTTLESRSRREWVDAVRAEWRALREQHTPLLLVGYSMGAAVALQVAAEERIPALALIAPLQRLRSPFLDVAWPVVRLLKRQVRPFRHLPIAWDDPTTRATLAQLLPGEDLDDADVRRMIRDTAISTRVLDELIRLGREAGESARYHLGPSLVVQARDDHLITRAHTLGLVESLSGPVQYLETEGGHDLVWPGLPGHDELIRAVTRFAWDAWEPVSGMKLPQYG